MYHKANQVPRSTSVKAYCAASMLNNDGLKIRTDKNSVCMIPPRGNYEEIKSGIAPPAIHFIDGKFSM